MGLFNKIKRQLLKVIEWKDDSTNVIAYRYPMDDRSEIMNGCQLIVRESQCAVLVCEGKVCDVYTPGRHKLETGNMPVLTALMSWPYGFNSPFKAEVYFVNTKMFFNQKWGTSNPVMMRDNEFGVVRLRAFGKFNYRVNDAKQFCTQILGTNSSFETSSLLDQFKSLIVTSFSDAVAESKISALDLAANYKEFSEFLTKQVQIEFNAYGIEASQVLIENISLPEEVEKMLDTRTQMGVMKDEMQTFMQFQTANAIRDAAKNESGVAGAGIGVGAGIGMGNMFAESMKSVFNNNNNSSNNNVDNNLKTCSKCGAKVNVNAKFCLECGEKFNEDKLCSKCGAKVNQNQKFCAECGEKIN